MSAKLFLVGILSLGALPAAAQPAVLGGFGGNWRAAIGAAGFHLMGVEGGQALGADQPGDPILGIFQTSTDQGPEFWTWRQSSSNLSSKALRESLNASSPMGVRTINTLLPKAGKGAWLVISRPVQNGPEKPVFLFTAGEKSEVYFADIPQEKVYGEGAGQVKLGLKLERKGESLSAAYGKAETGFTEVHRFSEKGDELLGFFEFRTDPAAKQPVLQRGRVYTDGAGLEELFAQPGAAASPGMKALQGNKELLAKMGGALAGGKFLSVTFDRFGNGQFTVHSGPDDKEGKPYLYMIGAQVVEAEAAPKQ
ncbi:MAG: hypothetical protein HY928_07995 [Elusimicrobia bacterium]|nr:hypothetical protein [Elusimicrobiota bacterium]